MWFVYAKTLRTISNAASLVSASLQDMLRAYKKRHGDDYAWFAEEHAVQLNDTHPVMAIPELTRLLMEDGFTFDAAFEIVRNVFAYTNHTVMSEALECWSADLFKSRLPRIYQIVEEITCTEAETRKYCCARRRLLPS